MLQVPGFWLTFLYYFAVTNLIVVVTVSQGAGISWDDRSLYQLGVLLSLVAGLLGAKFNRSVTIDKSFTHQKSFEKTLKEALASMGFESKSELGDFTVYEKTAIRTLFAGKVFVKIDPNNNCATIIGRASMIQKLNQVI